MAARDVVASLLGELWPSRNHREVHEHAGSDAIVFSVSRPSDGRDVIQIRTEEHEALLYVYDAGPIEFDTSTSNDRSLLSALLEALRDGRLRGVGRLDRRGAAVVTRLDVLNAAGEIVESVFLPVEVPHRRQGERTSIAYEAFPGGDRGDETHP